MLTNKKRILDQLGALSASVMILLAATGCKPNGPQALEKGREALAQGNIPAAVKYFESAVSQLGTNDQAWNYLGVAYHRAGKAQEAAAAYKNALKYNPDLTEVHYNYGCLLLEQNRPELNDLAQNEFAAFAVRQPRNPEAWMKLGTVQLRMNHFQDAEKSFRETLRLNPQSAEAMNNLGVALLERRRFQDALGCFSGALRIQPGYSSALQNAATTQLYLGNRPLALQRYREFFQLVPRPANADEVALIVRQLDSELNPQPVAAHPQTPLSTPVTNQPLARPGVQAASQPARAEGSYSPQKSGFTPRNNAPESARLESSRLAESQPGKTAVAESKARPSGEDANPVAIAESAKPTAEVAPAGSRQPRKGLLSHLNPANLFSRNANNQVNPIATNNVVVTPLPEPTVVAEAGVSPAPAPSRRVMAAPLSIPKYPYMGRFSPETGNRAVAQQYLEQGEEARRDRRTKDAVAAFSNAVRSDQTFFDAQMALAAAALDAGDLSLSLRSYESAVALKPESFYARYGFGLALKKANYIRDAAEQLETVLSSASATETASRLATAHLALGNLYADQFRQPAAARPHYLKVLELDPSNPQSTSIRFWLQNNP